MKLYVCYRCSSCFFLRHNVYLFIILYIFVHVAKCKDEEKKFFYVSSETREAFWLGSQYFSISFLLIIIVVLVVVNIIVLSISTSSLQQDIFSWKFLHYFSLSFQPNPLCFCFNNINYVELKTHGVFWYRTYTHTQQNHFVTIMRFLSSIVIIIIEITRTMHTITVG